MLYICIPSYNEGPTIGVLLWRIRKVFQAYSREYEIIVYDDGSTDETRERLDPYAEIAPLTVLRSETRRGYAHAVDRLCREVSRRTKYPRRDAMILMQGDFTDQPEHLPELVKRFEGGADIVIAEREFDKAPAAVKRLRALAPWSLRFFVDIQGVTDPFNSFRLYRISLLRELVKSFGEKPLVTSEGWGANVELLMNAAPLARRIERVTLAPRYDVRVRGSRIRPISDGMALYRFGWSARGRKIAAASVAILCFALSAATPLVAAAPTQVPAQALVQPQTASSTRMPVPFGIGEKFNYDVKLGSLKVGSSAMEVRSIENIRGRDAWHTQFWLKGGTFFYRVNDVFESWIDIETFSSLRFVKQLEEGTADRAQQYEIYPERGMYVNQRNDKPTRTLPTVRQPLDDGSFLYFVRTLPLVVGQTYDFSRYFIPDRNPVRIKVLRREVITVPAGTFKAIVVQPVIKTKGIFSEDGHAEVWLSDDSARMVLQLKSRLVFGSLNLYLTSYSLAAVPAEKTPGN